MSTQKPFSLNSGMMPTKKVRKRKEKEKARTVTSSSDLGGIGSGAD